jgi:Histidine kinase-, DNA gyrase B-, and HSP90-like ATPase
MAKKDEGPISAKPSKSLFIDMLTRDIGVIDCILDLVDNSVDKAVELSGFDAMQMLLPGTDPKWAAIHRINIRYTPSSFEIEDTCGGMSIKEAKDEVFLFGNPEERTRGTGLSVFGIGLKRAIFKLGRDATVASQTADEFFTVPINVTQWQADEDNWSFDFGDEGKHETELPASRRGTKVTVRRLSDPAKVRLADPTFEEDLQSRLASTYALFLAAGLRLSVNGSRIQPALPSFASGTISVARQALAWNGVDILLLAGVAPPSDTTPHGWYLFCNGRMVVEADHSELTGWGDGLPTFHVGKYRRFIGYVYFRSEDVNALPWRTTKQGVDPESEVYRVALREMRVQGRAIVKFLSDLYPSDLEPDSILNREVLSQAQTIEIRSIPRADAPFRYKAVPAAERKTVRIQYDRPRALIQRIARHLGRPGMSGTKVGEETFDYFVERELE